MGRFLDGLAMERMLRTTLAALAALAIFAGCRNVEQEIPETGSVKTVHFRAATADTRTAFTEAVDGVYQTLWTENDSEILLSLNYGKAEGSAVTASADGTTATFAASFDASATASPYTFYAVSPASAARAISPSRDAWSVCIAAEQTPSALSVDEGAQLLVAKSAASATLPDEVDLHFSHLTAYGRITLKNLDLDGATVSKAYLVFDTPVVGEWYWGEDGTIVSNGASHTITLHTDATGDLWFACAPVSVGGCKMSLSLFTDKGILYKEVTFPEGRSFASGKVARFSVDMASAEWRQEQAYVLLTDASLLRAGDEILIVNKPGTFALGAQVDGETPHREQAAVTVVDDIVTDPGEATVLTLVAGSVDGTWALKTDTGHLCAESRGNVLTESKKVNGYSSWSITISKGNATVTASSGGSKLLRYSSGSAHFSCYPSSNNTAAVCIYRKSGRLVPVQEDPLMDRTEYGSYITGAERTYVKGSDQLSRRYTADGKVEFCILNEPDHEQVVISGFDPSLQKGATAEVTFQYRRGYNTLREESYVLTVVKEDGPKVWLGDGTGQGFIIKK